MRTLVVSDLHLGGGRGAAVLERPGGLDHLLERLGGVDRLVLLGDLLELRAGPAAAVLRRADPVLRAIGAAFGGEVVVVAGNHDHRLAAEFLSRHRASSLAPEQVAPPPPGGLAAAVCDRLGGRAVLAYPGLWLAAGVYASHGHYQDLHSPVATVETIAAATLARLLGRPPRTGASSRDYERPLRPIYAFNAVRANLRPEGARRARVGSAARSPRRFGHLCDVKGAEPPDPAERAAPGAPPRRRRESAPLRLLSAAAGAAGLGPFRTGLDAGERRRAHAEALAEALRRLGVAARHVVFGHTHLAGTVEVDGMTLVNSGSWTGGDASGPAVLVEDGRPPRLIEVGAGGS